MSTPRADGDAERHFTSADGGLRGHQIGDVDARNEKDEKNENAESEQSTAIRLLKAGSTGRGWTEVEGLIEFAGDILRRFVEPRFGAFGFEGARDGVQFCSKWCDDEAGFHNGEGAMPSG